jgi:intracellular sulfur oxidation DsrE/DsrF family protein
MFFTRRNALARLLGFGAAGVAGVRAASAASAGDAGVPRVAYHLSDKSKVSFVIGNIRNHIEGMGGPDKVKIVLVVHGLALSEFRTSRANPDITRRMAEMVDAGVGLAACGNTLNAANIDVTDLLPGFVRVDEGGVVKLAQLQAEGYAYLRP